MKRIENSQNCSSKEETISNLKHHVVGSGGNGFTTRYIVEQRVYGSMRGYVVGSGGNGLNRGHVVGSGGHGFTKTLF